MLDVFYIINGGCIIAAGSILIKEPAGVNDVFFMSSIFGSRLIIIFFIL